MVSLALTEFIDEAAELAGLDPSALTHRHLASMKRSLDLLFVEMENEGAQPEYRVEMRSVEIAANMNYLLLPEDTIDVLDVAVRHQGRDRPLSRMSRQAYLTIADKTQMGEPSNYWVSKTLPTEILLGRDPPNTGWSEGLFGYGTFGGDSDDVQASDLDRKMLVLWPGINHDAHIVYNRLRSTASSGALGSDVDARREWLDTIMYGLALRTAEKWGQDRVPYLMGRYKEKLERKLQDDNRNDITIGVRGFGFSRRRRH